jgi:hypothetical protein
VLREDLAKLMLHLAQSQAGKRDPSMTRILAVDQLRRR